MCNPPFYSSAEDVDASLATKELEPFAVSFGVGLSRARVSKFTRPPPRSRFALEG